MTTKYSTSCFLSDSYGPLSNLHNRQTLKLLFTIYTVLTVELELTGALTMIWTFFQWKLPLQGSLQEFLLARFFNESGTVYVILPLFIVQLLSISRKDIWVKANIRHGKRLRWFRIKNKYFEYWKIKYCVIGIFE